MSPSGFVINPSVHERVVVQLTCDTRRVLLALGEGHAGHPSITAHASLTADEADRLAAALRDFARRCRS